MRQKKIKLRTMNRALSIMSQLSGTDKKKRRRRQKKKKMKQISLESRLYNVVFGVHSHETFTYDSNTHLEYVHFIISQTFFVLANESTQFVNSLKESLSLDDRLLISREQRKICCFLDVTKRKKKRGKM